MTISFENYTASISYSPIYVWVHHAEETKLLVRKLEIRSRKDKNDRSNIFSTFLGSVSWTCPKIPYLKLGFRDTLYKWIICYFDDNIISKWYFNHKLYICNIIISGTQKNTLFLNDLNQIIKYKLIQRLVRISHPKFSGEKTCNSFQ